MTSLNYLLKEKDFGDSLSISPRVRDSSTRREWVPTLNSCRHDSKWVLLYQYVYQKFL